MLPGRRSDLGLLFITTTPPAAGDPRQGGIAMTPLGQVCVVISASPAFYVNGFGVTAEGRLCISDGIAPTGYQQGLPFGINGVLATAIAAPAATDPYVGGVRVGALGVLVTPAAPPPLNAFNSGFDTGFD